MKRQFLRSSLYFALIIALAACSQKSNEEPPKVGSKFCGTYTPVPNDQKHKFSSQDPNYKVGKPYKIKGRWYYPCEDFNYEEVGTASWYGPKFHGKKTANGERYNMHALTAAHRTLPMPSLIEVTNLENGKSAVLKVTDRGPYARNRIIDVSREGAKRLGMLGKGTAQVKVRILKEESMRMAGLDPKKIQPQLSGPRSNDVSGRRVLDKKQEDRFPWQQPIQLAELPEGSNNDQIQKDLGYIPIPLKNGNNVRKGQVLSDSFANNVKNDKPIQLASLPKKRFTPTDPQGTYVLPKNPQAQPFILPSVVPVPMPHSALTPTQSSSQTKAALTTEKANKFQIPSQQRNTKVVQTQNLFIQAGSFSSYQNAQNLSKQLQDFAPCFVVAANIHGKNVYRVRLGPLQSSIEANMILNKMNQSGFKEGTLISEG